MKEVAIIGAGASGLACIKEALEAGFNPTAFEAESDLGGVWAGMKPNAESEGRAWPDMMVNISRHTGVFADFPWPDNAPDFPKTAAVQQYLKDFANKHGLLKHIHFNRKVFHVHQDQGKWVVTWQNGRDLEQKSFDALIVATGKFNTPIMPEIEKSIPPQNKSHSSQYAKPEDFKDKVVFVVGNGLSGTSIAEDLAGVAKKVIHLGRTPRWVVKRYDDVGNGQRLPRDIVSSYERASKNKAAEETFDFFSKACSEQMQCPAWTMTLSDKPRFVIADHYFDDVKAGKIVPISGKIVDFNKNRVTLSDKSSYEFDHIIFCTGYERKLLLLPTALRIDTNRPALYEDIFAPGYNNLAFIGMYPGVRGSVFPILSLQAQRAFQIFSGQDQLPEKSVMEVAIANPDKAVTQIAYLDSLAEKLGTNPKKLVKVEVWEKFLATTAWTPARYALAGPKPGAALLDMAKIEALRLGKMGTSQSSSLKALCVAAIVKQNNPDELGKQFNKLKR